MFWAGRHKFNAVTRAVKSKDGVVAEGFIDKIGLIIFVKLSSRADNPGSS
jgi:hypothetical protein